MPITVADTFRESLSPSRRVSPAPCRHPATHSTPIDRARSGPAFRFTFPPLALQPALVRELYAPVFRNLLFPPSFFDDPSPFFCAERNFFCFFFFFCFLFFFFFKVVDLCDAGLRIVPCMIDQPFFFFFSFLVTESLHTYRGYPVSPSSTFPHGTARATSVVKVLSLQTPPPGKVFRPSLLSHHGGSFSCEWSLGIFS